MQLEQLNTRLEIVTKLWNEISSKVKQYKDQDQTLNLFKKIERELYIEKSDLVVKINLIKSSNTI